MFKKQIYWALFLGTLILISPHLDLMIAQYFYQGDSLFTETPFFSFLYNYGTLPAWVMAIASTPLILYKRSRPAALVLILSLAIGSGLLVNGILKEYWGRPRPAQTIEFGGTQPFRPFYSPNFFSQEPSKSFSCGHCTMGFYFFAWVLIGRRFELRLLTYAGWILALSLGGALSLARMAQGGHYFSDVVVSCMIMWVTAKMLDHLILGRQDQAQTPQEPWPAFL